MIKVTLSVGELIDKISILELKQKHIKNNEQLKNIVKELNILKPLLKENRLESLEVNELYLKLYKVNSQLWEIEDKIREKEKEKNFDKEFVRLARSVYFTNDKRAQIKKEINIVSGSQLVEEKSYSNY